MPPTPDMPGRRAKSDVNSRLEICFRRCGCQLLQFSQQSVLPLDYRKRSPKSYYDFCRAMYRPPLVANKAIGEPWRPNIRQSIAASAEREAKPFHGGGAVSSDPRCVCTLAGEGPPGVKSGDILPMSVRKRHAPPAHNVRRCAATTGGERTCPPRRRDVMM